MMSVLQGLTPQKLIPEFLYPPESRMWCKFFTSAKRESQGEQVDPVSTKMIVVRPLKPQALRFVEVNIYLTPVHVHNVITT